MKPLPPLTVIGLMSGTSADGIDAALVMTDGVSRPQVRHSALFAYPESLRGQILQLYQSGMGEIDFMGELDRQLGELFAEAALSLCQQAGVAPEQVDLIGSHGQTIRHRPPRFTLQIGNPFIISARTGITTIADFRPADVARQGEGAPLTPAFHQCLFQEQGQSVAVVNLGGIANITAIPAEETGQVVAGDCGPANSLLDLLSSALGNGPCDWNGRLAAAGCVDQGGLDYLLAHPYFARAYPKSTGREDFGADYLAEFQQRFSHLSPEDSMATLTQLTVQSVADSCKGLLPPYPQRLVLCGGGARNGEIVRRLQQALPQTRLFNSDDLGVAADSLEAQAFAWFAARTWYGLSSSLPGATGCLQAAILGSIHPGRLWPRLT
ncbi:MAG: anhydro-N-acetylmuramic acid kinase [Magnetococcales bacterium]|nr:anhydro-N-acetylmuramic acid kinase [Magnetococcales bacterium]NGZ26413.1 anhydro-N-acetylmuramic acid kinase [Magnetococcales bacterium]